MTNNGRFVLATLEVIRMDGVIIPKRKSSYIINYPKRGRWKYSSTNTFTVAIGIKMKIHG